MSLKVEWSATWCPWHCYERHKMIPPVSAAVVVGSRTRVHTGCIKDAIQRILYLKSLMNQWWFYSSCNKLWALNWCRRRAAHQSEDAFFRYSLLLSCKKECYDLLQVVWQPFWNEYRSIWAVCAVVGGSCKSLLKRSGTPRTTCRAECLWNHLHGREHPSFILYTIQNSFGLNFYLLLLL